MDRIDYILFLRVSGRVDAEENRTLQVVGIRLLSHPVVLLWSGNSAFIAIDLFSWASGMEGPDN